MRLSPNGVIKFGILTGILAMFFDAAIGHGLFWINDPYWTYWVTDAFLIATIVSLGSSFIGIGIWQGVCLIAGQALVLEFYYEFLTPVGLPQQPYWLSHYDIWTTGYPVHFLVYFAGYLCALWIWHRKIRMKQQMKELSSWKVATFSLITALLIVLIDSVITHRVIINHDPGFTFFLQRTILAFVFLYVWNSYIGLDFKGLISGATLLSLLWLTYNMYLGPVDLPQGFPSYLNYTTLWFMLFPGALVSAFLGLWSMRWIVRLGEKKS